jgi:hypothetical protein
VVKIANFAKPETVIPKRLTRTENLTGWVDKENLKFNTSYLKRISEVAPNKSNDLNDLTEIKYADLFKTQPFQEKEHSKKLFVNLLSDNKVKDIFNLN